MKRKYGLCFLLSLFLLITLGAPLKTYGAGNNVTCSTQTALEKALANASKDKASPTVITISKSIDIDGQIVVEAGTYVTLKSASASAIKTLMAETEYGNRDDAGMLFVKGNLTIQNLTLDADYMGRVCLVNPGASLTLGSKATIKNGQEMGNNAEKGMGIYVRDGQKTNYGILKMQKGAKITGCRSKGHGYRFETSGIGVYLGKYGRFTMTGGEISSNQDKGTGEYNSPCAAGGGVYVQNYATMTMSGGKIIKNTARVGGGGIYVNGMNQSSQLILKGDALIAENKSAALKAVSEYSYLNGGGIFNAAGIIKMSEDVVIRDNQAKSTMPESYSGCGGGLYMAGGEFYMEGGSFTGNVAELDYLDKKADSDNLVTQGCGGAIFIRNGSCYIKGGSITDNQAKSDYGKNKYSGYGGGICVGFDVLPSATPDSKVILTAGKVKNNKAAKKGKDLYQFNKMYNIVRDRTFGPVGAANLVGVTSHILVSGKPVIGDCFLPSDYKESGKVVSVSRITLQGKLKKGASVGVRFQSPKKNVVLADHTDSYTIRNSDITGFKLLGTGDAKLEAEINNKGNLVLVAASSASKKSIAKAEVTISSVTYNGKAQKPAPKVVLNGKTLKKDTDYRVSYEKNTAAGTANCVINGSGSYTGTVEKTFKIKALSLTSNKITIAELPDKYASGKAIKPVPVIMHGDYQLNTTDKTDFTCAYSNNIEPGIGTVTVTGKGNYTGSKELSFQILSGADAVVGTEVDLLAELTKSQGSSSAPVRIVLDSNIKLSKPCQLASGFYGILDGNGHEILMNSKQEAEEKDPHKAMIMAEGSGSLELEDVILNGNSNARLVYVGKPADLIIGRHAVLRLGKASAEDNEILGGQCIYNEGSVSCQGTIENALSGYFGSIANYGTFTLEETGILRKLKTTGGGAVYNVGTFNLQGGSMINTSGASTLGAAITNKGSLNITSGSIEGSNASVPAIYNVGQVTMSGGSICNNNNSQSSQVGVSGGTIFQSQGSFTMTGGSITGNTSLEGGAVMMQGGSFRMNGASARISDNQALYRLKSGSFSRTDYGNGGGIFLNGGEFILEAGSVTGNEATYKADAGLEPLFNGYGGAVFVNGGKLTIKGGSISGNKSQVKSMEGIYFGSQSVGSTAATAPVVSLAGSPDIQDLIYMEKGKTLTISGKLGASAYTVKQEGLKTGTVLANYANAADGQEEDGGKFTAKGSDKTYSYDKEHAQISVAKLSLAQCQVSLEKETYSYTGRAITPDVKVLDPKGKEVNNVVLKTTNNIDCGTATVVVSGDGYETTGEVTMTFKIVPRVLADKNITILEPKQIYTGEALTPEITVKNNGRILVQDQDYMLDYLDNVDGDNGDRTGVVEITGMGNYTGIARAYFSIKSEASISIEEAASVVCGESITLKPVIEVGEKKGASYRYKPEDASIVKISSKGVLTGLKKGSTKVTVTLKESDLYYEASAVIEITTSQGKQSISGVNDTVNKAYTSEKWSLGATSTGDGKLSYKSSDTSVATINKNGEVTCKGYGQTRITITAAKTDSYKKAEKTITLNIKPKTLSVKSIKNNAEGSVKVTWAKDGKADGYQLQYSTDSSMSNPVVKTIGKNDTLSYVIKDLKKGKTCYVQIRAYKKVGSQALVGSWSKTKSVKVSK